MVGQLDEALKGAAELVEESKVRIAELEAEVALLTNKKTGPETSVTEIFERYPGMEDEIHQEIANFDFKKVTERGEETPRRFSPPPPRALGARRSRRDRPTAGRLPSAPVFCALPPAARDARATARVARTALPEIVVLHSRLTHRICPLSAFVGSARVGAPAPLPPPARVHSRTRACKREERDRAVGWLGRNAPGCLRGAAISKRRRRLLTHSLRTDESRVSGVVEAGPIEGFLLHFFAFR